jgi:GNAT superfamily N-acetyltransferase
MSSERVGGVTGVTGVTVRFLNGVEDTAAFRDLYDGVLVPSFRPAELADAEALLHGVRSGRGPISVAVGADETVLGGMAAEWHDDSRVLLMSYFAVRPGWRRRGIGHALIDGTYPSLLAKFAPLIVLGEAEDPRYFADADSDSGADYGDPADRLRLYERHGARVLPLPYMQPEIRPGHGRVPHLLLMAFAVDEAASPAPGRVDGSRVDRFLHRYFTEAEGPARADDADLARLREACRRPGGLPLHSLGEVSKRPGPAY